MNHIFVSSTFTDLNNERDYIFRNIGTAINDFAAMYGEEYKLTDLRLGIEDTKKDSETICSCLKFLKAAPAPHPFIVILGERHGWEPDEKTVNDAINSLSKRYADIKASLNAAKPSCSITEMEINYGAYGIGQKSKKQQAKFRERTLFIFKSERSSDPRQDALLQQIKRDFPSRIVVLSNYGAEPLKNPRLRADLLGKLIKIISNAFSELSLSAAELERKQHENYMNLKAMGFYGRKAVLSKLHKAMLSPEGERNNFTYIYGESGAGKSSLLSKITLLSKKSLKVFPIFCGLTKSSDSALEIMREIYSFLKASIPSYTRKRKSFIDEYNAIFDAYDECEETTPLLISIDAIDQLRPDSYSQGLMFLPRSGHKKISFIFSGTYSGKLVKNKFLKFKEKDTASFATYELEGIKNIEIPGIVEGIFANELRVGKVADRVCDYLKTFNIKNPLYLSIVLQRISLMSEREMMHTQDALSTREGAFIDIINEFMLNEDGALVSLNTLCVRLLESCALQYNKLFFEIALYISQSRHGLPISVIKGIYDTFEDRFNEEDFYVFCFTLNHIFVKRRDGRIDFTHKCFRNALDEYLNERERDYFTKDFDKFLTVSRKGIHKTIFEILNAQADSPIKDSEIFYHAAMSQNRDFIYKYIDENTVNDSDNKKTRQIKNSRLMFSADAIHENVYGNFKYLLANLEAAPLSFILFYLNAVPKSFSISLIDSYNLSAILSTVSNAFFGSLKNRYNNITKSEIIMSDNDTCLPTDYHKEPLANENVSLLFASHSPSFYLYYATLASYLTVKLYDERKYQFDLIKTDAHAKNRLMTLSNWIRAVSRIYEHDLSAHLRKSSRLTIMQVLQMLKSSFKTGDDEDFGNDCILDFYDGARQVTTLRAAYSKKDVPPLLNDAVLKLLEAEKLHNDASVKVDCIDTAYEGTNQKLKRGQLIRNFYKFRELAATDDASERAIERYVVFIKNHVERYNELECDKDLVYKICTDSLDFLCRYLRYYGFHKYAFEAAAACLNTLERCFVPFDMVKKYYYDIIEISSELLGDKVCAQLNWTQSVEEFLKTLHLRPERYQKLTAKQRKQHSYEFLKLRRDFEEKKIKAIFRTDADYPARYTAAFENLLNSYQSLYSFCEENPAYRRFSLIHQKEFFKQIDKMLSAANTSKSDLATTNVCKLLLQYGGNICNDSAFESYRQDIASLIEYTYDFNKQLSDRGYGSGLRWEWKRPSKKGGN